MKFPKAKTLLVFVLLISLVLVPAVHSQVIEDIDDDDENVNNNNNNAAPATADAPVKSEEPAAAAAAAAPAAAEENAPAPKAEPAYNFDEDEFEGIEELKKKKKNINNKAQKIDSETLDKLTTAAKQQQQQQGKKMSTFEVLTQAFKDKTIWDFKMEFGFIGFVLVYTLFVFIGKTQNQNYVVRFVNTAADFLTHNFAVIGSSTALKAGTCGDKVSLHEFNLPLTGRRNMKAACLHFIVNK